jgi:hypothetical protein
MTDFVLEEVKNWHANSPTIIINYANFLKQPLELWMFVPCDDNGNVLEHPNYIKGKRTAQFYNDKMDEYQQAKERVLFDFHIKNAHHEILFHNDTIEDLVGNGFILTPTAIKK